LHEPSASRAGHAVGPRRDEVRALRGPRAEKSGDRLAPDGVIVRDLVRGGLLRASVDAWNDDSDSERLLAGLAR
jgi:hypothetical protein